jgi:hypothetical protein
MLDQNYSHNQIAKVMGRSQSTISTFAKAQGYSPLPERVPSPANQARREYGKQERLALLNLVFEKGEEMLQGGELSPREYKETVTGIAIAIDKSRLEEGSPTSRHETRQGTAGAPGLESINLEEMFSHLDQLQAEEDRADSTTEYGSPNPGYPGMQPE